MSHFNFHYKSSSRGFTFVEILIVAPIVILVIGAFITAIVAMTGDVLASRANNVLDYNIQDALNRIQADVRQSTGYLGTNNVTLTSPQGYNDDSSTNFTNVGSNGTMLILNTLATTGNPISPTSSLVYQANQPNLCTDTTVNQNAPLTLNVIYFLKTDTTVTPNVTSLWRRTIMPSNYTTVGCATPWQQPSCSPGYSAAFCKTQDIRLVDNVTSFAINYYTTSNSNTENTVANNTGSTALQRTTAMQGTPTINVSITAGQTVAGRAISQSASLRATRSDNTAANIAAQTTVTTPVAPTVTTSLTGADSTAATFSWQRVPGATSYTVNYSVAGGTYVNGVTGTTSLSYSVTNTIRNNTVCATVYAVNSAGTSPFGSACITIPLYTPMVLQNGWGDYNTGFASSAYTKTSGGLIVLKGLIKGGTAVADSNIAVLPVGYRPANTLMFAVSTNSTTGRLDIRPDGTVRFEVGSNAWFSLDGINFMPSGTTFIPLTPINSWINYTNSTYSNPIGYTQASDGRVSLEGLVANGTTTAGTAIATIPAAIAPPGYEHIAVLAGNAFGIMSLASAGSPVPNAVIANSFGTNAFDSTQALFYPYTYAGATALTLQNSWTWYGTIYSSPRYTKSADGMVVVNGLIHAGTAANGTVVATLPVGYRPAAEELFLSPSNGAWGRMDVLPNGNIITDGISNAWVSLDTIAFFPEQ
jgi:Tfp pilus assembly protein PilE